MARRIERLTQGEVARMLTEAAPGLYPDGAGLGLRIGTNGAASWSYRYTLAGKARERGLGSVSTVSLKEARQLAAKAAAEARNGRDVVSERKAAAAPAPTVPTFRDIASRYIEKEQSGWRSDVHAFQWRSSLERYVYPTIGDKAVDQVTVADVAAILAPIWLDKAETANRVRSRIETVLDMAIGLELHRNANVATLKVLEHRLPGRPRGPARHFAALPYGAMPKFMESLRKRGGTAAKAVEFIVLTGARSMEARGASWGEVDSDARLWTIPASRMKGGREHVVPLSDSAMALLAALRPDLNGAAPDPTALLFPSPADAKEPLSDVALSKIAKLAAGGAAMTIHGFRSTFRDWAGDCTDFPREVAEAALAHVSGDSVEQAYRRGTALAKRRELMETWSDYVDGLPAAPAVAA